MKETTVTVSAVAVSPNLALVATKRSVGNLEWGLQGAKPHNKQPVENVRYIQRMANVEAWWFGGYHFYNQLSILEVKPATLGVGESIPIKRNQIIYSSANAKL